MTGDTDLGRQTLASADQTTNNAHATQYLWAQAVLERTEGDLVEAEATAHRCLSICRTTKFATVEVESIEVLAGLAADLESHDVAARLLGRGRTAPRARLRPTTDHAPEPRQRRRHPHRRHRRRTLRAGPRRRHSNVVGRSTRLRDPRARPTQAAVNRLGQPHPAELAVVNLVADGMSNQQVADRLFVGRRTIGTHLTHIFAKLGVTSRRTHRRRTTPCVNDGGVTLALYAGTPSGNGPYRVPHIAHQAQRGGVPPNAGTALPVGDPAGGSLDLKSDTSLLGLVNTVVK